VRKQVSVEVGEGSDPGFKLGDQRGGAGKMAGAIAAPRNRCDIHGAGT